MSNLAQTRSVWEVVLEDLERRSVCWRGNPLSERDLHTFTEAIVMCALHLTDMSSRHDGIGTERAIIHWAKSTTQWDVAELGSFLSDAITDLRHVASPGSYGSFKRELARRYPLAGTFLAPIKTALKNFLREPNSSGFYVCYQFLSFLTHLTLLDCEVDLCGEYEELESYLQSIHYPESVLREMNSIMRDWMSDFSLTEETFHPMHGPGAIAEVSAVAGQLVKYQYLGTDALIDYAFSHYAGIDVTSYFADPPFKGWKRECKVVFVPKSMKTRRTISKEPATLMFLQQGVASALVDYIHQHPFLRGRIDLRDQARNAVMAIESSASQRFATIDLSSASDTVTLELVKAVFKGTPVYPYLVALRSRTAVLPNGKVLGLTKYAPMGSALCFPVETLIFACSLEYAVRRARRTFLGNYPYWRAYGDDLIVEEPLFHDALLALEQLGFITNHSKSFDSCARFRESCGGEGYDGCVVTPLRISRRFYSVRGRITARHAAIYSGLVDLANQCYVYQFPLLRAWVIRVLLDNPIAPPLFSAEGNGSLLSPWPDNYRAKSEINKDLQRRDIQVAVASTSPRKVENDDQERYRYHEALRLLSLRRTDGELGPDDRVLVPGGTGPLRLRKRWVESPWR